VTIVEGEKRHILLVEDEALIAMLEQQQLEKIGYSVVTASNAAAAVEAARKADPPFDAILMDIDLGRGQDGTQAAAEILGSSEVPIIFVSSHTEPEIVNKTEQITSYGYVVKNSGIVVLDASIKMALKLFAERMERQASESRLRSAERSLRLSAEILGLLNEPRSLQETSKAILRLLKERLDFDAVGIRLKDGDDFPYFSEEGFDPDFLRTENSLALRTENGVVCRDTEGEVCLQCTCGLVLMEKCGPPSDRVTGAGSLWTNDALATLRGEDPRLNPRDRCSHDGFQSVALIPIRVDGEVIGLLHINDRRKNRFSAELVGFFEGLTASFGIAVERKRSESALRASEERLRDLLGRRAEEGPPSREGISGGS